VKGFPLKDSLHMPNRGSQRKAKRKAPAYPFSAIVGQDEMKLALILSVIDPRIGGVLIMGHRGTGKSTAVRALAGLLPEINIIADCPYGCDPSDEANFCNECAEKESWTASSKPVPVVDLPLGATEDRVCGTIDIERAINQGQKKFEPGLLARANRGFLYIDEVNLLDDHLVDVLLDVAASGWNKVERESVSIEHPASFVLIGSGNPEEGELRPQLLDRFGLHAEVMTDNYLENRVAIVEFREAYDRDPEAFAEHYAPEQKQLRKRIAKARAIVGDVVVSRELLRRIAQFCAELKVDGHRGELTTMRAARALAAFEGRKEADEEDVRKVVGMALRHRLRRDILEETATTERIEQAVDSVMNQPPPKPPANKDQKNDRSKDNHGNEHGNDEMSSDVSQPSGARGKVRSTDRDQPTPPPEKNQKATPQWDDDLSKHQRAQKSQQNRKARGMKAASGQPRGRYSRAVELKTVGARVALDATVRALAVQRDRGAAAIRYKLLKHKEGTLYIFAIDTSGSMAANRIARAKASILKLLRQSYLNRDHVAVVSFHGTEAEVALPPSRSILRARRVLDSLRMGGSTPLSAGLACTIDLIRRFRDTHRDSAVLLFTDGHANVALSKSGKKQRALRNVAIENEIRKLSAALQEIGSRVVVVDVQREFESSEESRRLAALLHARFVKLGVEPRTRINTP
jgi:magnesium chelatase subunit D